MLTFFTTLALTVSVDLTVTPGMVQPGGVVLVVMRGLSEAPSGTVGSSELTFVECAASYCALVGIRTDALPQLQKVAVDYRLNDEDLTLTGSVEILPSHFEQRTLTVSKEFVRPPRKQRQQQAADQVAFNEAFSQDYTSLKFDLDFVWPRNASVTAPFGDLRVLNGEVQSQHQGLDLDGAVGSPIVAAQSGTVVLVRKCFTSGNTVVIDHGGRVFTTYFHLSSFSVKTGQSIVAGQRLGWVGRTGRITGPHLHFGVKVDGRWVDPLSVLALRFADSIFVEPK